MASVPRPLLTPPNGTSPEPALSEAQRSRRDGDGTRVTQLYTPYDSNGNPQTPVLTVYFMGGAYEVTGSAVKKYYAIAGMTVAMNDGSGLKYLLTDHLGSVVGIIDSSGTLISQQRYLPFGQVRTDVGPSVSQTDFGYTGQRSLSMGLMDYHARMYDPYLNRWTQPDSIIPQPYNPQSWNRFSYALNNPIRYNDPSGHDYCDLLHTQNLEDCTAGEQRFASKTRRNIPSWDQNYIKNVKLRDISAAETAFRSFINNPSPFAEYFVNPSNAPLEYDALDLFAQYTVLHTRADDLILDWVARRYGMSAVEALYDAQLHNVEVALANAAKKNGLLPLLTAAAIIPPINPASYNYRNPPGPGWIWKGDPELGQWYNPKTGEALRVDLTHHGELHYDITSADGVEYRLYPDGTIEIKNK